MITISALFRSIIKSVTKWSGLSPSDTDDIQLTSAFYLQPSSGEKSQEHFTTLSAEQGYECFTLDNATCVASMSDPFWFDKYIIKKEGATAVDCFSLNQTSVQTWQTVDLEATLHRGCYKNTGDTLACDSAQNTLNVLPFFQDACSKSNKNDAIVLGSLFGSMAGAAILSGFIYYCCKARAEHYQPRRDIELQQGPRP